MSRTNLATGKRIKCPLANCAGCGYRRAVTASSFHARCGGSPGVSRFVLAGTARQYARSRPFDIRHLALDLDLLVAEKRVKGSASLEFERVASQAGTFTLDAVGFDIESVALWVGEASLDAPWQYDGDQLHVEVPLDVSDGVLHVEYSATPRRGLYFIEPDATVKDRPRQVWSQCQDQDARHWFPCHDAPDAKMTSELRVSVPEGWVALSNGELLEEPGDGEGPRIFHFAFDAPHPSYLMTLAAGEFSVLEDRPAIMPDGRSVPVRYYVPRGREADAWRSLGTTPQIIEHFSQITGVPYPWSRYSQVVVSDFTFGGMENTTATTLYEYALLDERAALDMTSIDLVAHELAHQWFGDYVTCRDWSEAWLNEGFATYFEHVEREHRLGREEYDWGVWLDLESYLGESAGHYTRPIVCREYQAPIDLFDRHLYEKGALVIHMLRRQLGDETFFSALREYLVQHQRGLVETTDLKRTFERVGGCNLDQFFDQWVYQAGHPDLEVTCLYEDQVLTVSALQKLSEGLAPIQWDFEIEFATAAGEVSRLRKVATGLYAAHVVHLQDRPSWVAFDPEFRVTVPVQLEFPADLSSATLAKGSSLRSRILAAQTLAKRTDVSSVTALQKRLVDEKEAWMVRAECARCLGKIPVNESLMALVSAVTIEHPKVRRAVATALGSFHQPEAFQALRPLAENDASYGVQAQACRAIGNTRQPAALETLRNRLDEESYADMVRAAAYDGLASLRDATAVDWLRAGTRYGKPARGRRAAIAALAKLGEGRAVREHLEDLLQDSDFNIRADAARALTQLSDVRAMPAIEHRLSVEQDGRVIRMMREALVALGASPPDAVRRLSDELTQLQRKLDEVRARVERVESAGKPGTHKKPAPQAKRRAPVAKKAPKRAPTRSAGKQRRKTRKTR